MKILAYHQISNTESNPLTVKTEMFLRQLDYLEDKGFNFISPAELFTNFAPEKRYVLLTFDHNFRSHYEVVFPLLKARRIPAIFFLAAGELGKEGSLTGAEIKSMAQAGFNIGAHSFSPPCLDGLPLPEIRKEIMESKKVLEEAFGFKVDFFSYPFGRVHQQTASDLVKAGGYKAAFFTCPWWRRKPQADFIYPRCGLYQGTNFFLFQLKLFYYSPAI